MRQDVQRSCIKVLCVGTFKAADVILSYRVLIQGLPLKGTHYTTQSVRAEMTDKQA